MKENTKITSIWLAPEIRKKAHEYGINISFVSRKAIEREIAFIEERNEKEAAHGSGQPEV